MRMRGVGVTIGVIGVLVMLNAAVAGAQGFYGNGFQNWNLLGMGARARGMGGAFLGVSDDGNAGTWNPAGLIYNQGVQLTTVYNFSHVSLGLDNAPAGFAMNKQSYSTNISNLSSASFLAPLTLREHEFYATVFYHRFQNTLAKGVFAVDDRNLPEKLGTPFTTDYTLDGNIAFVGAGFGTVVAGNLTMGATLNLATGDGTEIHNMVLDSTRYARLNPLAKSVDEVRWYDKSDIDYAGLTYTIGAMYRTDRWSVGMVFTPKWTLTQNMNYFGTRTKIVNNGVVKPQLGIVSGPTGTDREITIPYTVGLGTSYHVKENLIVALDYQFRAYKREGRFQYQDDPVTPDAPLETMKTDWYNLHQVRIGMEYMKETDWGVIPIRLGVRNDPLIIGDQTNVVPVYDQRAGYRGIPGDTDDPRETRDLSPRDDYFLPLTIPGQTGSQINTLTFAFGSGIHWSQIHLDFSLEIMGYTYNESGTLRMIRRCDECDINDPKLARDVWGNRATDDFGRYSRRYEDDRVRFSLNFTGYF